jgi:hypothetical protein
MTIPVIILDTDLQINFHKAVIKAPDKMQFTEIDPPAKSVSRFVPAAGVGRAAMLPSGRVLQQTPTPRE